MSRKVNIVSSAKDMLVTSINLSKIICYVCWTLASCWCLYLLFGKSAYADEPNVVPSVVLNFMSYKSTYGETPDSVSVMLQNNFKVMVYAETLERIVNQVMVMVLSSTLLVVCLIFKK